MALSSSERSALKYAKVTVHFTQPLPRKTFGGSVSTKDQRHRCELRPLHQVGWFSIVSFGEIARSWSQFDHGRRANQMMLCLWPSVAERHPKGLAFSDGRVKWIITGRSPVGTVTLCVSSYLMGQTMWSKAWGAPDSTLYFRLVNRIVPSRTKELWSSMENQWRRGRAWKN